MVKKILGPSVAPLLRSSVRCPHTRHFSFGTSGKHPDIYLKILKMSADWSGALIYVCAVTAKMLRWFHLGNLRESEHGDVLPTPAYYVMYM